MRIEIKRLRFLILFIPALITIGLYSCKDKKDTLNLDYGYSYAPLDTGHYVVYDVDSIRYQFNGIIIRDTASYQLMELVADTFYNNLNELTYRIELFKRADSTLPWGANPERVWYANRTITSYLKTEDDIKFIKLVFPPVEGEEWNGNAYVSVVDPFKDFQDWAYSYENVDVPFAVNGLSFDSTALVTEVNDSNAIAKRLRKEVYAKGVGMIYQEWELLRSAGGSIFPNWQTGNIEGFRIRMKVREYN